MHICLHRSKHLITKSLLLWITLRHSWPYYPNIYEEWPALYYMPIIYAILSKEHEDTSDLKQRNFIK